MANDPRSAKTTVTQKRSSFLLSRSSRRLLTLITAVGLGVDAYVHRHLAVNFDTLIGSGSPHISQGELFRLEAGLALIAMVMVLSTRRGFAAGFAFLIAAGGLGALLLYGYVDVGGFGPFPDMYDPIWYKEKTISAIAETVPARGGLGFAPVPGQWGNGWGGPSPAA